MGDSITAGAINLMPYNGTNYYVSEDGNMSYDPLLSRLLDADWSVVAKSGGGREMMRGTDSLQRKDGR